MHPTLAKYLDLEAALDTLKRHQNRQPLDDAEKPFAQAADAFPHLKDELLGAKSATGEVQQALLTLAAHAAVRALDGDPAFTAGMKSARAALAAEEASDDEREHFLASLVVEEAFMDEAEADRFDAAFFAQTLEEVPALAKLTRDRVDELEDSFVQAAPPERRPLYQHVARALMETAWEDGPQPINPEHVEEAFEHAAAAGAEADRPRIAEALRAFVRKLAAEKLVSALRLAKLERAVGRALVGPRDDEEEEDDEDLDAEPSEG